MKGLRRKANFRTDLQVDIHLNTKKIKNSAVDEIEESYMDQWNRLLHQRQRVKCHHHSLPSIEHITHLKIFHGGR